MSFNKYFMGGIYIIKLYIFKHSLSFKLTQNIFVFFLNNLPRYSDGGVDIRGIPSEIGTLLGVC